MRLRMFCSLKRKRALTESVSRLRSRTRMVARDHSGISVIRALYMRFIETFHLDFVTSCSYTLHIHTLQSDRMINQRLSRTLQTFARQQQQCVRLRRTPSSLSPFQSRSFAPVASQRISGRRWYSQAQEAESKKEESVEAESVGEQKPAQDVQKDDPVQKELETRKKEVIDLTVCPSQITC